MASTQFQSLVAMMRARPAVRGATIEQLRQNHERTTAFFGPLTADYPIAPENIAGCAVEWHNACDRQSESVLVYFHGGGYCTGSLSTHRYLVAALARESGVRALAVDYRLAPEHPFPAAVHDGVAVYRELLARGLQSNQIILAGDSAGGGLALATIIKLRDVGVPLPAAVVCLSPWTDLAVTGISIDTKANADPLLAPWEVRAFAKRYLNGADPRDPLASPLYADFNGMPPMLIHVGGAEILLDDSTRLVKRAEAAGVRVTFRLEPEMIHVWHYFAPLIPEGRAAIVDVAKYIRVHAGSS